MLTLNDGRAELWQWDTGRTLAVDADCSQVHFSNKVFGRSIDVDVVDGVAGIPDILLQSDKDLNVWAFVGTSENGYTKISKTFKVNRRNKPADYVFTPQEQITLKDATAILEEAKDVANGAMESAKQAADSSTQAEKSADAAADSASAAAVAKQAAAQSASASDNAANFAGEKATAAQQAADTATAAANYACQSASAAAASKAAAETAAKTAQDALTATSEAKADAVKAQVAAAKSASDAQGYMQTASSAATTASASAENAAGSAVSAENSASAAARSEQAAGASEVKAAESEKAAKASEQAAAKSAQAAMESKTAAATSEVNAAASAKKAQDVSDSLPADYVTAVNEIATLKQQVANITPDDSNIGDKPWTSKKIVDTLCQPFEESGNPVQCYPVENYPLGVKVSWEPVQEGSGDPSPENIRPIKGRNSVKVERCGENCFDFSRISRCEMYTADYEKKTITIPSYTNNAGYVDTLSDLCPGIIPGIWIISAKVSNPIAQKLIYILDTQKALMFGTPYALTSDDLSSTFSWYNGTDQPVQNVISDIQVTYGSTPPTTYTPYIGQTNTLTLPETVYGGTLDVETGVVTVDRAIDVKTSNEIRVDSTDTEFVIPAKYDCLISYYALCNCINGFLHTGSFYRVSKTKVGHETLTELQEALGDTPIQICYKLKTPYTIQLNPQQIAALSGVNTLYTDADGVVVTGAEDPKHTITELKNSIISLGGNI